MDAFIILNVSLIRYQLFSQVQRKPPEQQKRMSTKTAHHRWPPDPSSDRMLANEPEEPPAEPIATQQHEQLPCDEDCAGR